MNIKLVKSEDGDWEAIYVDGVLAVENHSLRTTDVLEAVELDYEKVELSTDWLEENGWPQTTDELPE